MMDNPPSIFALELHEILLRSHTAMNAIQKRFIDALRALHDSQLCRQLGFPNIVAYAKHTFRYGRSRTCEFIQVSRALLCLPRITRAFESGSISFELTARLSEVATDATETEWLDFLEGRPVEAVLLELKDAKRKERDTPRKGSFGLPGLPVKVTFELSPEEHAIYETALEKVRAEIAPALDGERLEPKEALLVLLRRVLETESMTAGRKETGLSPFTIILHRCTECGRGALQTRDGRVELEPQALERIAGEAKVVMPEETAPRSRGSVPTGERDKPNSPALRIAVCQRDGGCCANPFCRRPVDEDGQAHHIEERVLGGRTELGNSAWLCGLCRYRHNAASATHSSTAANSRSRALRQPGSSSIPRRSGRRAPFVSKSKAPASSPGYGRWRYPRLRPDLRTGGRVESMRKLRSRSSDSSVKRHGAVSRSLPDAVRRLDP